MTHLYLSPYEVDALKELINDAMLHTRDRQRFEELIHLQKQLEGSED